MRARELAKSCDFTVLRAGVTAADLAVHCADAARLHVASVVVPPAMARTAADILRGGDVKVGTVVSYPFGTDDPRAKATGPSPTSGAGHAPASQPPDGGSEWMATSQPILDVNEAILWVDDEPLEDSPLSR